MMLLALVPMALAVELPSGTATAGADSKYTVWFTPEVSGTLSITVGDGSANWSSDVMYFDDNFSIVTVGSASGSAQATYTAAVSANTSYLIRIWATDGGALPATPYVTAFTEGSGGDGQDPGATLDTYVISDQQLSVGANRVQLDGGANTTVYAFTPGEKGIFTVTAPDGVNLGYWGGSTSYVFDATADKTNILEVTITDVGQSALIGVSNTDIASTTLTIQKTGEVVVEEYTEVIYENTGLGGIFTLPEGAVLGDYVDVYGDAHTAVAGEDGYYHLDSADGPILLVDMDYLYVLTEVLDSDRPVMYYYDTENLVKYNIQDAVLAYEAACDENGYYPLTEDLMFFYREYAEGNGIYSFCLEEGYNPDCAWMFACLTMHFHQDGEDDDHLCDYCDADLGESCYDTDPKDHACDECGGNVGQHTDGTDNDHLCDYGCGQFADNGCHDSAPKDHVCDECGESVGVHDDAQDDGDHVCDYGCSNDKLSDCEDADSDHVCDECAAIMSSCADLDTDNDHNCDVCGKENVTNHVYVSSVTKEPTCTETGEESYSCNCGHTYTEELRKLGHKDDDNNNLCDVCDGELCSDNDHIAAEGSHFCQACDKRLSDCTDSATDADHLCDICAKRTNEVCADGNNDHRCDVCANTLTQCSDALTDEDHKCDVCGQLCSNHHYVKGATVDPTCTQKGYTLYTCNCGDSKKMSQTDTIPHDWANATCTQPQTCCVCGATQGEPIEHSWDEGVITEEPTTEKEGVKTYTCHVCGATKTEAVETLPEPTDPTPTEPEPTEPEATEPEGTIPQTGILNMGQNNVELVAEDLDGETWTFTATEDGTLTIEVTRLENLDAYTGVWNDGTEYVASIFLRQTYCLSVNEDTNGTHVYSLEVTAGDVVTIQLYTFYGHQTKATIDVYMGVPDVPTEPEETVPDVDTGAQWEETFTAPEDGILTLTISGRPGWAYQYYHGDMSSVLHTGSAEKKIPFEVYAGESYLFAFWSYSTLNWSFANGVVDFALTFEPAALSKEEIVEEYEISSQTLVAGVHNVTMEPLANLTAFVFAPMEPGIYTITAPEGVALCHYGTKAYPFNATVAGGQEMTNRLTVTITSADQALLIGVDNPELLQTQTTLDIQKTEEYVETVVELEVYENQAGLEDFALPDQAQIGQYVDVYHEDHIAVLGKDGYYHLDSAEGPILLIDLDYLAVLTDALDGGRGIMYAYVLDGDGNIVSKYDIAEAIQEYEKKADENGYYPLTADLIFFYDTYAAGSGTYEFYLEEGYNPQCAWMFACITVDMPVQTVPPTGDCVISLACAALLLSAMSIVALPKLKREF